MAAISTFDQWQKDVFFSAAEEVQESADTMESVCRMWVRERSDGSESEFLDELRRDLHTALGTAKWQLEEFERAVNLTHENFPSEENTITRHREFVAALRNNISRTEQAIRDSLLEEGKQPLRWVQLDEEERDDFENFLSTPPEKSRFNKEKKYRNYECAQTVTISKDADYVVQIGSEDEVIVREENLNGQRRATGSADVDSWKIVIADEDDANNKKLIKARVEPHCSASSPWGFVKSIESVNWLKSSFKKAKSEEDIQSKERSSSLLDLKRIRLLSQGISRSCFGRCRGSPKCSTIQRSSRVNALEQHFQGSQSNNRSLRVTLLLMITIFLIVPFVLYST